MLPDEATHLRMAYFAHSLRSDWNNGNAHFLRGLIRSLVRMGHRVTVFEPESGWSVDNLQTEPAGARSLAGFALTYPELDVQTYAVADQDAGLDAGLDTELRARLAGMQIVILHEWNAPALARRLLRLREELGFKLLFHDTHHRASSSPEQIEAFGLTRFDGVLAFGEALRTLYRERFGLDPVWTLHEAADVSMFRPRTPSHPGAVELVWVGNWGEGERAAELQEFLLGPAARLRAEVRSLVYGVRYPAEGLAALTRAGVAYGGYLPNLEAPAVYAGALLTLHVPRQVYAGVMRGIPTIRVFEALACGIPLISAPWEDVEELFRPGDFRFVRDGAAMTAAIRELIQDPAAAAAQAARGLETVRARHTCDHRARELTAICHAITTEGAA